MIPVSVIISYCSNESIFIHPLLQQCRKFSDDIIVSYGSHLYDGRPEDQEHFNTLKVTYPFVKFVEYNVDINMPLDQRQGAKNRPTAFFHNLARYEASKVSTSDWVFVIDADEIPDGDQVAKWLSSPSNRLESGVVYKIANYWYFKDPRFRARTLEDSVLLINRRFLTKDNIFGDFERDFTIRASGCPLDRQIKGVDNVVMFHHFSWVRTREGLAHKVKSWAHVNDIFKGVNVEDLIDHIYRDANPNDIVHRYEYDVVENKYNIDV